MTFRKAVAPVMALLVCILSLSACGGPSTPASVPLTPAPTSATAVGSAAISVSGAWLRMPLTADAPGAAYLVVRNSGADDKLVGVESDIASQIEMHQSSMSGGVMQMSPVKFILIPAGGQAELKPGGYHLMLIGIKHSLKIGTQATLNLTFEKAGLLFVAAQVRE